MKLISMTDFVLEQKKQICEDYKTITEVFFNRIVDYANFLKQEFDYSMIYAEDEREAYKVLFSGWHESENHFSGHYYNQKFQIIYEQQNNAYELFLRDSFEDVDNTRICSVYTVEDLLNKPDGYHETDFNEYLMLTESALKQIGLNH